MSPSKAPRFSWPESSARRLERSSLLTPASAGTSPAVIAAATVGTHAQVISAAELSIALRIEGAARADVHRALWEERTLVKTHGPRGTVHLLPTQDLPMWTGALSSPGATRRGQVLMTPEQTETCIEAIGEALADAELTTDELTEALAERAGSWAADRVMDAFQDKWPRWRSVTHHAAHRGALCYGPMRGRKITYTSPQRWLPGFKPAPAPQALAELALSYLKAYGPATPQHFARWMAAQPGWATELFATLSAAGRIEQAELEGAPAWIATGDTALPSAPPSGLRLLPYFDAYGIASQPRERLFPGPAYERCLAEGQAGNYPLLLIDGEACGVWHQRRAGRRIHVTVEPLRALTAAERGDLDAQVTRVGEILEATPELTIGQVTTGAHA